MSSHIDMNAPTGDTFQIVCDICQKSYAEVRGGYFRHRKICEKKRYEREAEQKHLHKRCYTPYIIQSHCILIALLVRTRPLQKRTSKTHRVRAILRRHSQSLRDADEHNRALNCHISLQNTPHNETKSPGFDYHQDLDLDFEPREVTPPLTSPILPCNYTRTQYHSSSNL